MSVKIDDLLMNMGEKQIKNAFLSETVLETLKLYDENLLLPSKTQKIIEKISKAKMIRDKKMRNVLIQSIREEKDIDVLAKIFNVKSKNKRDELLNIRIKENSDKEKKLFAFFNTDYVVKAEIEKLPEMQDVVPKLPLFKHQRDAIEEIEQYLNTNEHAALLHMPTGSGKTRTAMRVISNIFIKDRPAIIVWVALTEELCEQAIHEFQQTWNAVGDRKNNSI